MRLCAVCRHDLGSLNYCAACWTRASCERQGVPAKVTNPEVLAQVVVLFGAGHAGRRP